MKQYRFIFGTIVIAAVILAGLSACSIDESRLHEGLRRVSIKATIENGPGTKVIIDDGDHGEEGLFHWNDDDALALYVVENGVGAYRVTENYGVSKHKNADGTYDNRFDIYMSPDATRTGFAFYPPQLVVKNDDYQGTPIPLVNPLQVFLPVSYLPYASPDGQIMKKYSPLPMIADNSRVDGNLNFRHLGGMIRIVFDSSILAQRFRVAVGDIADGEFRAYKISGIFDVINPDAESIDAGNCYIKTDETEPVTGDRIWSWQSPYSINLYPSHNTAYFATDTLNIPVPTGHYTAVMIRVENDNVVTREGIYSLGPDGWTCQRRHAWKLGVTLNPIGTEYYLDTPQDVELTYTGGTASLRADQLFKSYKTFPAQGSTPATDKPVPYHLEYSEDGTNWSTTAPDWLAANSPSSFAGSVEGEDLTLTMEAQVNTAVDSHHNILKERTPKADFDLATLNVATGETVNRTTANCYVVQAPGTYKFPLVYGNGVKNGAVNESAYYQADPPVAAAHPFLTRFKDHLDNDIMSPYIATQLSGKTLSAVLIWQDVQGLVTVNSTISGSGENAYVTFTVPEENITQGNALVAVLVDDDADGTPETIAWSWHIWVTDEDLTNLTDVNNFKVPQVNLGWCDARVLELYEGRSCQVRAVQTETGGKTSDPITVTQTEYAPVGTGGNCTYYQWGRKDPLQAADGTASNTAKTYYDASGNAYTSTSTSDYRPQHGVLGKFSIGTSIREPQKDYFHDNGNGDYGDNWCSTDYLNLWNSTLNSFDQTVCLSAAVTKTIYDPSPVGFKVPPQSLFTGFTDTDIFPWAVINGDNGRIYNNSVFFPVAGYRYINNQLNKVTLRGRYWTAAPQSPMFAATLNIEENKVMTPNPSYANRGYAVRPVAENDIIVTGENLIQWD